MSHQEDSTVLGVRRNGWAGRLDAIATIVVVVAACVLVWVNVTQKSMPPSRSASLPLPEDPISLQGAPVLGTNRAKIAILEFSDFECPYCARFAREVFQDLVDQHVTPGRVLYAFKQFPLDIHPSARRAAEVSVCATDQGNFWTVHDQFFGSSDRLGELAFADATVLGLKKEQLESCLNREAPGRVDKDIALGVGLHINSTPTFLVGELTADGKIVGRHWIEGIAPISEFTRAIEAVQKAR